VAGVLMARELRRVRDLRAFPRFGAGRAVDKDGEPGLRRGRSGGGGQIPQPGQDPGKQALAGREPQDQVAGVTDQPARDGD
jgi:hypothetical protein